ncbi:FG-GAP repeat protein [Caballeronia arvi]|uniref:FG-GAP repeat protein n=1 Tax=Caballeronia arvi TaxID=1777135 RepID=A0A158L414_9BURK|nr:VCBS repeat-containing protein [Caballeronia arvi]SAL87985.1 FG-GAP repeat protein [Caballeronia arvi]
MGLALREYMWKSLGLAALCTVFSLSSGEELTLSATYLTSPRVASTSYENAKALNIGPQKLPYPSARITARAFGDFFQRGAFDLFVATTTFDPAVQPERAARGAFEFWRRMQDNTFVRDSSILLDDGGCVYPTKAVVADFNRDGKPDIFVACRGLGTTAFVGERSAILLSQHDGTYKTSFLDIEGAFVSAAAADLTGTGRIDVVAVDGNATTYSRTAGVSADEFPIDSTTATVILVNDGQGRFVPRPSLMTQVITDFTDVEALDLNGDGRPDIVLLGADGGYGQPSIVMLNDGTGSFANVKPVVLPRASIANPAPQDLVFVGNALYVSRTDASAHGKRTIQRIGWPGLDSTLIDDKEVHSALPDAGWMVPVEREGKTKLSIDCVPSAAGLDLR